MIIRSLRLRDGLTCTMDSMFHETSSRKKLKGKSGSIVDNETSSFVQITEQHWKNFSDILDVLEPLKSATEIMSGDSYPSLNMVLEIFPQQKNPVF